MAMKETSYLKEKENKNTQLKMKKAELHHLPNLKEKAKHHHLPRLNERLQAPLRMPALSPSLDRIIGVGGP